jgi:hypothetical protein
MHHIPRDLNAVAHNRANDTLEIACSHHSSRATGYVQFCKVCVT